ncbi:MAG: hypothetical protein Q7U57_19760 [Methylovulum sp.]|nr:hypothetical protein [Methylovulum sp.]
MYADVTIMLKEDKIRALPALALIAPQAVIEGRKEGLFTIILDVPVPAVGLMVSLQLY